MFNALPKEEVRMFVNHVLPKQKAVYGPKPIALVVDDDPIARFLMTDMMLDLGYDVIIAHNGREALSFFNLRMDEIALVVTDNEMPELDGLELIHTIGAMERGTAMILVSASNGDIARRAESEGAVYVHKPSDARAIFSAVIRAANNTFH